MANHGCRLDSLDEGISAEELPPLDWPVGHVLDC